MESQVLIMSVMQIENLNNLARLVDMVWLDRYIVRVLSSRSAGCPDVQSAMIRM